MSRDHGDRTAEEWQDAIAMLLEARRTLADSVVSGRVEEHDRYIVGLRTHSAAPSSRGFANHRAGRGSRVVDWPGPVVTERTQGVPAMGVDTHLTRTQLREFLGVNTFGLRRVIRREDFPAAVKHPPPMRSRFDEDDDPVWDAGEVYRWAAHDRDFAHRGALLLRPATADPAPGRWAGAHSTPQGPTTDWHTDVGTVRLVHTDDSGAASAAATALANDNRKHPAGTELTRATLLRTRMTPPEDR
ncbi:hypothetical protein [Embleya sp. NPDC020630]|uniref:hypothetical protein n=1 Tax=Embleya sp. NPDC020630 TaxID=3363979 RepID=UPI00379D177D